jgi:hypothetical protein
MLERHTASSRSSALAFVCAGLATVALVSGDSALAQSSRSGAGEVVAVRELELKPGIDPAEFDRFVVSTFNPAWEGTVPGVRAYIARADRGARKGSYALVLIFDSEKTRDAIYPKEGGGVSERFGPLLEGPFQANQQLDKYIDPGTLSVYTDYVALR